MKFENRHLIAVLLEAAAAKHKPTGDIGSVLAVLTADRTKVIHISNVLSLLVNWNGPSHSVMKYVTSNDAHLELGPSQTL